MTGSRKGLRLIDDEDELEPEEIPARSQQFVVTKQAAGLPPCALCTDPARVEEAVQRIRAILAETVSAGTERVGEYLLSEFYNNEPSIYSSASHHKHASLRLLEDRCETLEFPVRKSFLAYAIRLAVLAHQLPDGSRFRQLPVSHRIELLRLHSTERVEQLAERASDQKLTVAKLRDIVLKEVARNKSTRGRKPLPEVVRAVNACMRMLRDDSTGGLAFRRDDINVLTEDQLRALREHATIVSGRIEELLRMLD